MQNKTYNRLWALWLLIIGLLLICMSVFLIGCQYPDVEPLLPTTPGQALAKTIIKTDWIVSLAIIGFALSITAFINGSKLAVGTAIGCGAALILQLTVVRYASIITWLGLISAVGLLVYTFYIKHKAFKEIILGIQKHKNTNEPLEQCLKEQNRSTKKIVSQIKQKDKNGRPTI